MKNAVFRDATQCGSLRTDVSEERIASIIRVKRIGQLGATLAITSNWHAAKKYYVKNGVFWDVTPCGSFKNRHFGGT
jgi:hypothetical protein